MITSRASLQLALLQPYQALNAEGMPTSPGVRCLRKKPQAPAGMYLPSVGDTVSPAETVRACAVRLKHLLGNSLDRIKRHA